MSDIPAQPVERLHDDEVEISDRIVRELIAEQFPSWASLPIRRAASAGTVNVIYRLGDRLSVRLPRAGRFEERETDCWLRHLSSRVPLPIPEPVAVGEPTDTYALHWTVHTWLEGDTWQLDHLDDQEAAADALAEFIHTLRGLDPADATCPPLWDGGTFSTSDHTVRAAAIRAPGVDTAAILKAWDRALEHSAFDGAPTLIHWDLLPGNVLISQGRIAGVIDWGALAFGDPSRDLLPTWTLFDGSARDDFRAAMASEETTWARARGWALAFIVGVAYYENTNPAFAAQCRATLEAVLDDLPT